MNYNFDVETLESGQRRKYGDSYYRYIIVNNSEVDFNEFVIRSFCTRFLKPAISNEKRKELIGKEVGLSEHHFATHYTRFEKTGDRTFEYEVTMPSTH